MQSVFVLADELIGSTQPPSKQAGLSLSSNKKQPPHSNPPPAIRKTPAVTTTETRTCRGCLVKGHIFRNCPHNPERSPAGNSKVMIARGEDDIVDEDVYDSPAYIINDISSQESSSVFFTATKVLLDNQAGRSIFKNKDLLSNISAVKPFYISGIDGESRGLCIQEDGEFNDLGRVGLAT